MTLDFTRLVDSKTSASNLIPTITHNIFNWHSILVLVIVLFICWFLGKLVGGIIHGLSVTIGKRADKTENLGEVNGLRRIETILILGSTLIRAVFIIFGLYLWWALTHPTQLTALIGASALLILLLSSLASPVFRDIALGGSMMAEKWFGVNDLVTIQPFAIQGIVEHVTLRSTRIRTLSGESVWVANQNIQMVEVVPRGVHPIAIELFMSDEEKAQKLIEETNKLIPIGTSLVISPLTIMNSEKIDDGIYHLTVIAEAAPWRDELITTSAVEVLKKLDEKNKPPVLLAEPIARAADKQTEKQFARVIINARKTKRTRRSAAVAIKGVVENSTEVFSKDR